MMATHADCLCFGDFCLNRHEGRLFRRDSDNRLVPVEIGLRALDVLGVLVARPRELVPKDEIIAAVWPDTIVADANLTVQISRLRRVLDDRQADGGWIQTVPGRGYRFTGDLSGATERTAALSPAAPIDNAGRTRAHIATSKPPSTPHTPPEWRVGRETLLKDVEHLLAEAFAGKRQTIFVAGEAGIGKTTVVEMAVEWISRQNVCVLRGHCTELFGINEAFLPLIDAIREGLRGPDGARLTRLLREHAPLWLGQMPNLPDAAGTVFNTEAFGATRERMLREFCDFVEAVAEDHPCVLVLEDMHWSDNATVDALARLARGTRPAALAVIATYRSDDVMIKQHPILAVRRELRLHGQCAELIPARLTLDDVVHYLGVRLGDAGAVKTLAEPVFQRTGGQPLFVNSLVEEMIARKVLVPGDGCWRLANDARPAELTMPDELREMLTHQIDRLEEHERALLEVASTAGFSFSAALISAAADQDVVIVERTLEGLARRALVVASAGESEWPDGTYSGLYSFRHALYQEVLCARLGPELRTRIHRRLGERLERGHGERAAEIAPVLALHFEQGRDLPRALRYLGLAAENSARRLANQEAAIYLTHGLTLTDRLPRELQAAPKIMLLRQRSWVRRASGDLTGCLDDLNAVIALAMESGELRAEVNGLLAVSRFALHADRRACLRAAARVLERSEKIEDETFRALVRGTSASTNLYLNGWNETDAVLCRQALEVTADATDHATLIRRHGIEGLIKCATSDYAAARNAATRGKGMTRALGDVFIFALFNVLEATALLHLGEWRTLRRETEDALVLAERNANDPAAVLCRLTLAWLYVEAHDFQGSISLCEGIPDDLLHETPFTFYFQRAVLTKAYHGIRDLAGTWANANDILRDLRLSDGGLDFTIYTQFHYCLSDHYIHVGDLARATEHAMILHAYTVRAPDRNHLALAYRLLARIAMVGGDHTEAAAHLERAVEVLGDAPLPLAAWRVHLLAAELHRGIGAEDRAKHHWRLYKETIHQLAGNFDEGDNLRASLLGALSANKRRLRISDAGSGA